MKLAKGWLDPWIWRMAWREGRASWRRLALFTSSIVLGVAALVAIGSFGANLETAIDEQARSLLGADLALRSNSDFSPQAEELIAQLGGQTAHQTNFTSMAYFPETSDFRLVQVRALEGKFPFYGVLETDPPEAAQDYQSGPLALVDDALMRQFEAAIGDPVRLGEFTFKIAGRLENIPGEAMAFSVASPRIFIPMEYLPQTNLVQPGSRIRYRVFFRFDSTTDVEGLVEEIKPRLEALNLRWDTVEERKRGLGRAMTNLYHFLNLVAFVALLLGALGIASAIHLYVRQKRPTVAVLRCLGANSLRTLRVYLIQAAAMGLAGAVAGSLLGIAVQALLPSVLQDFLPVEIPFQISWEAALRGTGIGLGISLLFALIPLLPLRRISPLLALRTDFEEDGRRVRDWARVATFGVLSVAICAFSISQTARWYYGVYFFLGLVAAFAILALAAKGVMLAVRRWFPSSWPYVWRQGLANLYRPQNQTLVLILALGLGTFLIATLHLVQGSLLGQAELADDGARPNLVFFDIQTDQKQEVKRLIQESGAPLLQDVPIVTMRLAELEGRSVEELRQDEERTQPRWMINREYRSTYRSELIDTETLVRGEWIGRVEGSPESIPISLAEGIAQGLGLELGDSLVFDVQGVTLKAHLASTRRVEWGRVQPNFFAVFPEGVLEKAPQFHVLVTRAESVQQSADLQRAVVRNFPNVSSIDLALILRTVDQILDKVSFVIRFMALFSIITGLTVLAGAVLSSRYQRIRESVLLRTLGASRRQVLRIMMVEYLLLGSMAALTGLAMATIAGWALAIFLFEITFLPALLPLALALAAVVGLTLLIGVLNSWGTLDRPPLEVLRTEGGTL